MRIPWRGAIGLALTAGLLWWALRDIKWNELRDVVANANWALVALSIAVVTMVYPLRALRWRQILSPITPNLPFGPLWRATVIGFMANSLLPSGRVGEFVRPYILSRETAVPYTAGFGSLIADRVFDVIAVAVLTLIAMASPTLSASGAVGGMFLGAGALFMGAIAVGAFAMVWLPDQFINLFGFFASRASPRLDQKGRELLRSFAGGLAVLRNPRLFVVVAAWAFALWLTQSLGFWIMMRAVDIHVPFSAALFVNGVIVLAVTVPSTPGYFGIFEIAGIYALAFYGIDKSLAVAWGLSFHVLSLIPIVLLGLYYLARSDLKLGELSSLKR